MKKVVDSIEMLDATSELFRSFSDPHRLGIMICLLDHERSVSEMANLLASSISSVSHQLKQLRMARLVSRRREGKTVFYNLHDHHVKQLILMAQEHITEL